MYARTSNIRHLVHQTILLLLCLISIWLKKIAKKEQKQNEKKSMAKNLCHKSSQFKGKRKESDVKFIRRMQEKNQDFKIQFEKKKTL